MCQRAAGWSVRCDVALNGNSPLLQCGREVNQVDGSTAAGIKYQSGQAGTGLLLSLHFFTCFNRLFTWIELPHYINTTYSTVQLGLCLVYCEMTVNPCVLKNKNKHFFTRKCCHIKLT